MKIFVTRKIPEIGISMLIEKGHEVDVNPNDATLSKEDLISALSKKPYDAVITLLTDQVDADVINAMPNVKVIANYAVGFNNIDLKTAASKNIFVTNTAGVSDESVAEHAVSMMLSLAHRIVEGDQFVRDGKYKGWDPMLLTGFDLKGLTLGLVGAGHIGEHVAMICKNGFDMKVIYSDVVHNEKIEKELGATYFAKLDDLLAQADVISLHVPLLPTTQHLINAENMQKMKKTAILINTSRGPVIDEKALVFALQHNVIFGAGLDVFESEPSLSSGLTSLSNVVLTPHTASATKIARDGMAILAAQNVIAVFEGKLPPNRVINS